MPSLSATQPSEIISMLHKNKFFSIYSDDQIKELVSNSEIKDYNPHRLIWRDRGGTPLDFCILISGCLVVWDKSFGQETIDALITSDQMIGEFEFLGYPSKSFEISALTNCILLKTPRKEIETLCSHDAGAFYRMLSHSLVEKLRFQNNLLKFRSFHGVTSRLIYLLDNFTINSDWKTLTNMKDEMDESFDIEIFWTKEILLGLLSTELRSLGSKLSSLISQGDLEIRGYNSSFQDTGVYKSSDFSEKRFPDGDYLKFRILRYSHLTRDMEI